MKVKYIGTASEVMIPGIGIVNPGDVLVVSDDVGRQLVARPDFENVVEPKVKMTVKVKYKPFLGKPRTVVHSTQLQSKMEVKE